MLNGEGNEIGIKINRSNQQKNKLHVQHTFFLISKKSNLHVQHAFCLSLPLFCTTTTLFCRTKTPNFLATHYCYGGSVVCAYPILLFFTVAHFNLAGRQQFSLSLSRFKFSCFSSYKIRLLFSITRSGVFSQITSKKTRLCCFFLSKSPGGHAISFQIKP